MKKFLLFVSLLLNLYNGLFYAQDIQRESLQQNRNDEKLIVVYPNPARDYLYLKTSNPNIKVKSVVFYSILGNIVADMNINASYTEIKLDKLKSGKYLMKYTLSDDTQKVIQIIKQ